MYRIFKSLILDPFHDLLYPSVCWLCDQIMESDQQYVCRECLNKLIPYRFQTDFLKSDHQHYDQIHILYEFDDTLRRLVHLFKYRNCKGLANIFAREAVNRFSEFGAFTCACVTAVPLHPVRHRDRGYNQSALLAEQVAGCLKLPYAKSLLQRTRFTPSQTRLSRAERRTNVAGAFAATKIPHYDRVLLVDDVVTTGSTVDACARILKEAGAVKVDILALANPVLGDDRV